MEIHLDRFASLLSDAEEGRGADDSGVSPYLLGNLLYPYLEGESIRLDSLDYDAFSLTDLDCLFTFIGEIEDVHSKTHSKSEKLWKSSPAARPLRAFC